MTIPERKNIARGYDSSDAVSPQSDQCGRFWSRQNAAKALTAPHIPYPYAPNLRHQSNQKISIDSHRTQ